MGEGESGAKHELCILVTFGVVLAVRTAAIIQRTTSALRRYRTIAFGMAWGGNFGKP